MKKIILILAMLVALVGCSSDVERQIDEEKYNAYLTYYQSILDFSNKQTSSEYFDITVVVNKVSDEEYRYDVVVDNPRVAMYNLIVLVIVDNVSSTINTDEMMPSIGIFEDDDYAMIPGQVYTDNNYIEGVDLSLTDSSDSISISVMVSFTNKDESKSTREYFNFTATYQEDTYQEEVEE